MREMLNGLYVHHTGQSKKRIGALGLMSRSPRLQV